jgi:hypothetical protein
MAGHGVTRVDESGIAPMGLADCPRPLGDFGRQDQMHVVGHQAIAPYRDRLPRAGLAEEVAVELAISPLAPIPVGSRDGEAPEQQTGRSWRTSVVRHGT